jgi:hypothetical protein
MARSRSDAGGWITLLEVVESYVQLLQNLGRNELSAFPVRVKGSLKIILRIA